VTELVAVQGVERQDVVKEKDVGWIALGLPWVGMEMERQF
jgi:hypothetical protein